MGIAVFLTHEARDREIIEVFFDRDWWRLTFETEPHGLIGAGTGLGPISCSGGFKGNLGYTLKESGCLDGSHAVLNNTGVIILGAV